MSTTNVGNQEITFAFAQEATSLGFSKLLYKTVAPGIIDGGKLSINGSAISIAPFDCLIQKDDADQQITVKLKTKSAVVVYPTKVQPYLILKYNYEAYANNYAEFMVCDEVSLNTADIVFGRAEFSLDGDLLDVDYTRTTYSRSHHEHIDSTPEFQVVTSANETKKLVVKPGKAFIGGTKVEIKEEVLTEEIDFDKFKEAGYVDVIIGKDSVPKLIYGDDGENANPPSLPANTVLLARVKVYGNDTGVKGSQIEQVYNSHINVSSSVDVDQELDETSTNPVENKAVSKALNDLEENIETSVVSKVDEVKNTVVDQLQPKIERIEKRIGKGTLTYVGEGKGNQLVTVESPVEKTIPAFYLRSYYSDCEFVEDVTFKCDFLKNDDSIVIEKGDGIILNKNEITIKEGSYYNDDLFINITGLFTSFTNEDEITTLNPVTNNNISNYMAENRCFVINGLFGENIAIRFTGKKSFTKTKDVDGLTAELKYDAETKQITTNNVYNLVYSAPDIEYEDYYFTAEMSGPVVKDLDIDVDSLLNIENEETSLTWVYGEKEEKMTFDQITFVESPIKEVNLRVSYDNYVAIHSPTGFNLSRVGFVIAIDEYFGSYGENNDSNGNNSNGNNLNGGGETSSYKSLEELLIGEYNLYKPLSLLFNNNAVAMIKFMLNNVLYSNGFIYNNDNYTYTRWDTSYPYAKDKPLYETVDGVRCYTGPVIFNGYHGVNNDFIKAVENDILVFSDQFRYYTNGAQFPYTKINTNYIFGVGEGYERLYFNSKYNVLNYYGDGYYKLNCITAYDHVVLLEPLPNETCNNYVMIKAKMPGGVDKKFINVINSNYRYNF